MTQPNKPSSWEKEALEQAEKFMGETYATGYSPDKNYCMHFGPNDMKRAYSQGARWAQEKAITNDEVIELMDRAEQEELPHIKLKAAPGEESWEKRRDELAEKHVSEQYPLGKPRNEFNNEDEYEFKAYAAGFDAAISLVAKPLKADVERLESENLCIESWKIRAEEQRDHFENDCKLLIKERDELKAEVEHLKSYTIPGYEQVIGELRADLDKAAATIECKDREISRFRQERYTLRGKLAEAIKAIEEIREGNALMAEGEGDDPTVYQEMARHWKNHADAILAKLKAPAQEKQ